ncbi:hypothetical protein ABIB58_001174 [Brevundimonas sp. UYEF29]|uniref:hypothetical protein n=1 Tax=unclassified Brevundimonas TaxID=2622653 RepID=UPI001E543BCD|nr:hypothetical protein [Brevundimonas sp. KM4]
MIQRTDVVLALLQQLQTRIAVWRAGDGVAVTPQLLFDQPGQTPIVVDVEQADGLGRVDRQISGAWITDRNRPS